MRHLTYVAVLAGCLLGALWVEPVLHVHVVRRWRRVAITLGVVVVIFGGWDVAAVEAGHWRYDPAQTLGVRLLAGLPLEELLFFVVVPFAAILGFEAVRAVRGSAAPAGDEGLDPPVAHAAGERANADGRPDRRDAAESPKRREPGEPRARDPGESREWHEPGESRKRCEPGEPPARDRGAPPEPGAPHDPGAPPEPEAGRDLETLRQPRARRESSEPEEPRSGRRPLS
jgi:lycopene cyclase domain-containing protein